jgi:hypothetical protein
MDRRRRVPRSQGCPLHRLTAESRRTHAKPSDVTHHPTSPSRVCRDSCVPGRGCAGERTRHINARGVVSGRASEAANSNTCETRTWLVGRERTVYGMVKFDKKVHGQFDKRDTHENPRMSMWRQPARDDEHFDAMSVCVCPTPRPTRHPQQLQLQLELPAHTCVHAVHGSC